jgi:hypothetical protein
MIPGLRDLYILLHPFNYARPLMAQRHGRVGPVGYEINFNRYFYRYTPARPLEEIEADIRWIEQDIMRMLADITGSGAYDV